MGCGVYWNQVQEIDRALATMQRFGIDPSDAGYQSLYKQRGELMARVGTKGPRYIHSMSEYQDMSPTQVRLWHDIESGFMAEIRDKPGATPRYKYIDEELAMAIKKRTLTDAQKAELEAVDYYVGE